MTNTAIIGTIVAFICMIAVIATGIIIVRIISRPSRRIPSPNQSSTAHIGPAHASAAHLPYARIPHLLTAAEGDFFAVLQAAAPAGMLIFAQIRLANLVEVQRWARRDKTHWYKIQAKCVDFVVCEPHTFIPRLVIELDDSSHDRADRQARDAFVDSVLVAAAMPILHVRWQRRYDTGALAAQIAGQLGVAVSTPIAAPLPEPSPAASDGLWHPITHASLSVPPILPTPAITATPASARPSASATPPIPMRRACGACQADLREGAKFCPSCGATFAFP